MIKTGIKSVIVLKSSELMFNKKDLKSNITSCNGRINTNFHNGEMPKEGSHNICLSVILIASVFKMIKTFLQRCF